ncbi:MAG TPA: HYR domain-containing protein, partial [Lentimicrobium sp.]|nr:HYR domain-containing protein [Lentimicrobium sp.]
VYSDNCGVVTLTWAMTGATTGNSSNTGINLVNGQTFNVGITTVTYTAYDAAGNNVSCSFIVWIKNLNAPQFHADCPLSPVSVNAGANCNTFVNVPGPIITNPCNELYTVTNTSPYKTSDADASGTYPPGTTTFTWTITDASGNITTCTQSVTVTDNLAPTLVCPGDQEQEIINGGCDLSNIVIPNPTFSDNCGVVTLVWETEGATVLSSPATGINYVSGQTFNVGITTVIYTAIDAAGNISICSFTVWLKNLDDPPFTATCPANVLQPSEPNVCGATVLVPAPGIFNPCNEAFTVTNDSPYDDDDASGFYPVGVTTIHWIITDASGNVTPCTQTVTITDLDPIITCPADQTYNADFEQNYASGIDPGTPTYSDNCGISSLTWVSSAPTPGSGTGVMTTSVFYVGVTTITYTVTDINGHSSTCSYTITVLSEPEITCPTNINTTTDPGQCSATLNPGGPTLISGVEPIDWVYTIRDEGGNILASDHCTTANLATCIGSFTFPVGVNTITWTATNISGVDDCIQTVTVVDDEPPTIILPTAPSFCVVDIFSAVYDGQPEPDADIVPESPFIQPPFISSWRRPDWYILNGTTELDITATDNCCTNYGISWVIQFAGNDAAQPDITGTGQPSTYGPIVLWGTPLNVELTHTITYIITDCNGNVLPPVTVNILIKPRPEVIKQ